MEWLPTLHIEKRRSSMRLSVPHHADEDCPLYGLELEERF